MAAEVPEEENNNNEGRQQPCQYIIPKRRAALREIRRKIIEGHTHSEIRQQLGLAERTYFRYVHAAFKEDRERLEQSITNDEILNQIAICEERFSSLYANAQSMATNPQIEPETRIVAQDQAASLATGILKLREESATAISRQLRLKEERVISL